MDRHVNTHKILHQFNHSSKSILEVLINLRLINLISIIDIIFCLCLLIYLKIYSRKTKKKHK
jgi:hypothetical protein